MNDDHLPRIDKYLWAVRIFKTRNDAADACRSGKVSVNGQVAKPSREVKAGDTLTVRKGPIVYSYQIVSLLSQRVAAKNLCPYIVDTTPPEALAKEEMHRQTLVVRRDRGTGRPTKKERRDIDRVMDGY